MIPTAFWSKSIENLYTELSSSAKGLSSDEAKKRIETYGFNRTAEVNSHNAFVLFLKQFRSPITLMLLGAAILSLFLGDPTDALIIFIIVGISSLLGFWQEKKAGDAVKELMSLVEIKATVCRDATFQELPLQYIVPGDCIKLSAGDLVPADSIIINSNELFTNEAAFTGESFPVEKKAGIIEEASPLALRSNMLFMGSHIISGTATALVIQTGLKTEFGQISNQLKQASPETDFEKGIRQLGNLLMQLTTIMLVMIFFVNALMHKPILDSFLFALALAVGLTPQLLPAIISVNLSKGASKMAKLKVIVKRLSSIESLGSMNVLCSDKTGTLTQGIVTLNEAVDPTGTSSSEVLMYASINATLQQGFKNPIDTAIIEKANKLSDLSSTEQSLAPINNYKRIDEIPYDFIRKRLSILTNLPQGNVLIAKGALTNILEVCTKIQVPITRQNNSSHSQANSSHGQDNSSHSQDNFMSNNFIDVTTITATHKASLLAKYSEYSNAGFRTLGIAIKQLPNTTTITRADESDMVFVGFLTFHDPLKDDATEIITQLNDLGIKLKVITGDNILIAKHIGEKLGFQNLEVLSGKDLLTMSQEALVKKVNDIHIFAEVEPNQKERIIYALKHSGNVTGYMGDGINDANALHAADVGVSVNTAVDVAKEAADLVLLDKDLSVLINGVKEGRKVFTNTIKYIFMATSANFGNMFSMAGASILLPFLPLLPKQILLTNLLTDFPSMAIATDNIDNIDSIRPRQWDIGFIKKFMIVFGILSSVFDYLTFAVLIKFFHASEHTFQTGWFLESVVSATLIVLVVRTRNLFYKSKPGKYLFIVTLLMVGFVLILPLLPFAYSMGFVALPLTFYAAMLLIVMLYLISAEISKRYFFKYAMK